jgi:hypothetical protein
VKAGLALLTMIVVGCFAYIAWSGGPMLVAATILGMCVGWALAYSLVIRPELRK